MMMDEQSNALLFFINKKIELTFNILITKNIN